jgi:exocyst complex component 4
VETIAQSKAQVTEMRSSLQTSKDWFACKRYDLLHLWIKSLQYKEMARVLEQVYRDFLIIIDMIWKELLKN